LTNFLNDQLASASIQRLTARAAKTTVRQEPVKSRLRRQTGLACRPDFGHA
jgi:hypothetical protein